MKITELNYQNRDFSCPDHISVRIWDFQAKLENPDEIGMVRQSGNCNVHVASIRCHTGTMNLFHVSSQTATIATTYAYYSCTLDNHEF